MILKLKRTPGIYLVGFMACGKTTIGKRLAEELGWHFADLDEDIEADQGMAIPEIFDSLGEPAFREIEARLLLERVRSIERGIPTVLSVGGGVFVQPRHEQLLRNNGVTVWLDCPLETLSRRAGAATHRPLARDLERFEQLYHERLPAYRRAEYRIEIVDDNPATSTAIILRLPIF